ncbi:hypothetical protein BURCENBC7_AP2781 [Burkholderia cenocepacia BC7]|nr:hypothetical protein BURCENK562V_C3517 [Burkholderia cenocepacia K56-2Valvano]ERI29847.1 hypothetical protein BURCENBC7_AP2781 [Burkholderia cenocepacia BC7]
MAACGRGATTLAGGAGAFMWRAISKGSVCREACVAARG